MALDWQPVSPMMPTVRARVGDRSYYIHRVGGLYELTLVVPDRAEVMHLGNFTLPVSAEEFAELNIKAAQRVQPAPAVSRGRR